MAAVFSVCKNKCGLRQLTAFRCFCIHLSCCGCEIERERSSVNCLSVVLGYPRPPVRRMYPEDRSLSGLEDGLRQLTAFRWLQFSLWTKCSVVLGYPRPSVRRMLPEDASPCMAASSVNCLSVVLAGCIPGICFAEAASSVNA